MKYNGLEVLEEFYSTAPDGSIGGVVVARDMNTGLINFYFGNRRRCTNENEDIRYFLKFGNKVKLEYVKLIVKKIEERESKNQ